jgi:signal transduction histidine kinase
VPVVSELLERVRELEANERRMASLLELGQRFMSEREPLALLRQVCEAARAMTAASHCGVAIVSEDLQRLERLEIVGLDDALTAELMRTLRIDDTIRTVLVTRQPARGRNPAGNPVALGLPAGHPPVHSFLIAPLASPSRVYGWFALTDKADAQAFSDVDERIATTLGSQVGMAYEHASLVARLQDQMSALRDHDADMEFAMSVARVGVSYRELDSNDIMVSRSLAGLLGLPRETPSIPRDDFLARVHQDDVDRVRRVIDEAVALGSEFDLEYRLRRPEGGWRWFRSNGRVTSSRQGQRARLFSAMVDVTESRLLEMQIQQAQKMDALGQLAGGVAHDFNNLLTAIRGYAELLLEGVPESEQPHHAEQIVKAAKRAGTLTKQLLAFSRRQVRATVVLDVNALVEEMAAMLRRMIREDIDLTTELTADQLWVQADRGQLEQVVMNLVVNARDAIRGGGTIRIETAIVDLDGTGNPHNFAVKAGTYVMLAVSDTGAGMTEETKTRLFEPFFTTKAPGAGSGLGLATVYGIVAQNGGSIGVDSEREHGATLKVYLPRYHHPAPALEMPADAAAAKGGSETILLVEDEATVRLLARIILQRAGYRVVDAASPADAELQWASIAPVDLLLTDVVMPGRTGPDLFRRLSAGRPDLPVLFMSGYADWDLFDRAGVAHPAAFLEKPFSAAALLAKVREALDCDRP